MILELAFPVYGHNPLPADHGYPLYLSMAEAVQTLRKSPDIAVHAVNGRRVGDRLLILMPFSELVLRLPDVRIGDCLPLTGQVLNIGRRSIKLGTPRVRALSPSSILYSQLVTIPDTLEPARFESELHRRLCRLGVA